MHDLGAVTGTTKLLDPSLYSAVSTNTIFLTQLVDTDALFVLSDNLLFKCLTVTFDRFLFLFITLLNGH